MKKALSLMLVLVLVLGMSTVAFAATAKVKKESNSPTRVVFEAVAGTHSGTTPGAGSEWSGIEATVQDGEHKYPFDINVGDANVSTAGNTNAVWGTAMSTDYMTKAERKASKITIKTNVKKGSAAVDSVDFDVDAQQQLVLTLVDELKNTSDDGVEFEVISYLVVDGSHWNIEANGERVTWSGYLKNELNEDVNSDYDYFYMGQGTIVKADGYIKSIELGIHDGDDDSVSVFAKLFNGKRYWAVADSDATDAQDEIMDKYGFDGVYNLRSVNLAAVATHVKLNNEDSSMFVYDGNLNLLGKGDSDLPWSDVYYLSATEIESDDEIEPTDDPSDAPEDAVPGGGDDDYPENVNDNPGTGC